MITALSVFCVYLGGVMIYGFVSTISNRKREPLEKIPSPPNLESRKNSKLESIYNHINN